MTSIIFRRNDEFNIPDMYKPFVFDKMHKIFEKYTAGVVQMQNVSEKQIDNHKKKKLVHDGCLFVVASVANVSASKSMPYMMHAFEFVVNLYTYMRRWLNKSEMDVSKLQMCEVVSPYIIQIAKSYYSKKVKRFMEMLIFSDKMMESFFWTNEPWLKRVQIVESLPTFYLNKKLYLIGKWDFSENLTISHTGAPTRRDDPPANPADLPTIPADPPANPADPPANPADPPTSRTGSPANLADPSTSRTGSPANPADPPTSRTDPLMIPADPPMIPADPRLDYTDSPVRVENDNTHMPDDNRIVSNTSNTRELNSTFRENTPFGIFPQNNNSFDAWAKYSDDDNSVSTRSSTFNTLHDTTIFDDTKHSPKSIGISSAASDLTETTSVISELTSSSYAFSHEEKLMKELFFCYLYYDLNIFFRMKHIEPKKHTFQTPQGEIMVLNFLENITNKLNVPNLGHDYNTFQTFLKNKKKKINELKKNKSPDEDILMQQNDLDFFKMVDLELILNKKHCFELYWEVWMTPKSSKTTKFWIRVLNQAINLYNLPNFHVCKYFEKYWVFLFSPQKQESVQAIKNMLNNYASTNLDLLQHCVDLYNDRRGNLTTMTFKDFQRYFKKNRKT